MRSLRFVMRGVVALLAVAAAIGGCGGTGPGANGRPLPLRTVSELPLPGGSSRLDYQSLDARRHLLWISHLGANEVIAVDTAGGVARRIGGISSPHGILVVRALDRVLVSASGSKQLIALGAADARIVWRRHAGQFPDGIGYDAATGRIFVSDEDGGAEVVFDRFGHPLRTIKLGDAVGNVQYDPVSRQLVVAVDRAGGSELGLIDGKTLHVARRIRIAGCDEAHGVSLDTERRRVFVACAGNAQLYVVDLARGRVAAGPYGVGGDPDVLAFDPGLRRLYVASEAGVVSAFVEEAAGLHTLGHRRLAQRAHTVAVDPSTHLVYFPLEDVHGRPLLRVMAPR